MNGITEYIRFCEGILSFCHFIFPINALNTRVLALSSIFARDPGILLNATVKK